MTSRRLNLRHTVIDAEPPGSHHDITLIADLNGDGQPEIAFLSQKSGILAYYDIRPTRMSNHGRPDIVGKPYRPERHIDVWFNEP